MFSCGRCSAALVEGVLAQRLEFHPVRIAASQQLEQSCLVLLWGELQEVSAHLPAVKDPPFGPAGSICCWSVVQTCCQAWGSLGGGMGHPIRADLPTTTLSRSDHKDDEPVLVPLSIDLHDDVGNGRSALLTALTTQHACGCFVDCLGGCLCGQPCMAKTAVYLLGCKHIPSVAW
jgi:hypothetical protein